MPYRWCSCDTSRTFGGRRRLEHPSPETARPVDATRTSEPVCGDAPTRYVPFTHAVGVVRGPAGSDHPAARLLGYNPLAVPEPERLTPHLALIITGPGVGDRARRAEPWARRGPRATHFDVSDTGNARVCVFVSPGCPREVGRVATSHAGRAPLRPAVSAGRTRCARRCPPARCGSAEAAWCVSIISKASRFELSSCLLALPARPSGGHRRMS